MEDPIAHRQAQGRPLEEEDAGHARGGQKEQEARGIQQEDRGDQEADRDAQEQLHWRGLTHGVCSQSWYVWHGRV